LQVKKSNLSGSLQRHVILKNMVQGNALELPEVESNPLLDPLRYERRVPPCTIVIYGANGDLAKRKLVPALYRLAYERRLPAAFAVIGISRTPMSDDQFRGKMRESVERYLENSPFDQDLWDDFAKGLYYMPGDVEDPSSYRDLQQSIERVENERKTEGNVLFYLSTQPSHYAPVVEGLGRQGLAQGHGWRRIVVEKPFGHDLSSARELNNKLHEVFAEEAVYRIDHYLGKETVQNVLAFRFGNGIFEPLWPASAPSTRAPGSDRRGCGRSSTGST
jgi:glucose-6-phosphate 1-dehydrogenase